MIEGARGLLTRQNRAVASVARGVRPSPQQQQRFCGHLRLLRSSPPSVGTRGVPVWRRVTATGAARFSSRDAGAGAGAGAGVRIAQGEDAELVRAGLEGLVGRGWEVDAAGMGIQKTFHFRTYFKAVSFVNVVASQSAVKKHHPTMTVRIGSVDVHWTTHHPQGLSQKDIAMAQHCEEGAELMGSVQETQGKKCAPPPTASLGAPSKGQSES
ncbi:4a-hydroxytetrahydrobiopterin dehydratase [Aspergillus clavatus NRRL 1]|uniref:4a-hydroxytetrahydrobiopterin dehydratase n=1 Tax=Aspergillus clavatus (strain ATCC 1007 / CBS 513.65 / DSM 816 / NCTC 3887 / NRRL 1 / QM 1276 / 107) TaxID=344612 RepID=A1C6U1_ASPCL|nr:pterin-4-alpha-carbinolamine dehydratase, putative [Aspergillus clavatus NRRL 1]EAW14112.1 pterin-4-alpha-carbinolamine dehydratase, putative [Aspergillus clavatus NRRL 1]